MIGIFSFAWRSAVRTIRTLSLAGNIKLGKRLGMSKLTKCKAPRKERAEQLSSKLPAKLPQPVSNLSLLMSKVLETVKKDA
jgi:hypothetical protein